MDTIKDNYNQIISILQNKEYENLKTLDLNYNKIINYAMKNDDVNLLKTVLSFGPNYYFLYISAALKHDYLDKFLEVLMSIETHAFTLDLFPSFIDDDVNILKKIISYGINVNGKYIENVLINSHKSILKYLIHEGHDIQPHIKTFQVFLHNFNIDMFKLFVEYNISFDVISIQIGHRIIYNDNLDELKWLHSIYPLENINLYFYYVCSIDVLKYLIQLGGDINTIRYDRFRTMTMELIKFLLTCGYNCTTDQLTNLLAFKIGGLNVNDVIYLIEYGAGVEKIFNNDPICRIVINNNFNVLKFLVSNYYDMFDPYINYAFIMVCYQNQSIEIAKFLLALGVKLDYDMLYVAVWFYNYDIIKLIFDYGIDLDNVWTYIESIMIKTQRKDNDKICKLLGGYFSLWYCQYTATNVFNLLIDYKVPITNFDTTIIKNIIIDIKCINYFIVNGLEINNDILWSVLIDKNQLQEIKYLLDLGARIIMDDEKLKHVENNSDMISLFKEYGYEV